ncbi:hypothetical protein ABW21_db0203922 [Orbilia brochopaga]|nr:hypothetical protein ABW21_db0203922 [Drechslerella brochopaga]
MSRQRPCTCRMGSKLRSITKTRPRARSTWRRKSQPRPLFSPASLTRPGISAIVKRSRPPESANPARVSPVPRPPSRITVPMFGVRVVKAQLPTRARLLVTQRRRELFPTFGRPTRPTSASSFSSSCILMEVPAAPFVAHIGRRRSFVMKFGLP